MTGPYCPGPGAGWERCEPADAGFDAGGMEAAVAFARGHESTLDRNIRRALENRAFGEPPPLGDIIGPTRPRGAPQGLVLAGGRIVAEWGETDRADITFSVAKSLLSICAGLLHDDGLIADFDAPVRDLVDDGGFEPPHNHRITWRHLLQQTSEWEGTLWGKPDLVDRHRDLSLSPDQNTAKGTHRPLQEPGSFWEYNDVRVNRLSLALLRVAGRPLPELFAERVMAPIGATSGWEWHGYGNSWVEIDGRRMQSVSGGSHWGGGVFIGSRDQARIGLLMLRGGVWNGRRLLSRSYLDQALAPSPANRDYGFLWWLNRSGTRLPGAGPSGYCAFGFGSNIIWIEPDADLVAVMRWMEPDAVGGFCSRVMAARRGGNG